MQLQKVTKNVETFNITPPAYFVGGGGVSRFTEKDGKAMETRIAIVDKFYTMFVNATVTQIDPSLVPCSKEVFLQAFDHVINEMTELANVIQSEQ